MIICGSFSISAHIAPRSGFIDQGQLVQFKLSSTNARGEEIESAETTLGETASGRSFIGVTLDQSDRGLVSGIDSETGETISDHEMTDEETIEHEIVGHVRDRLTGGRLGDESNAIRRENEFRRRNGSTFRRTEHRGRVVPRR